MPTAYNKNANRFIPSWEREEGMIMPEILKERFSAADSQVGMPDISSQVQQEFPEGLPDNSRFEPDVATARVKNNVAEFPEEAIGADYQDPLLQIKEQYRQQALAPQVQDYSPEQKARKQDSQAFNELLALLDKSAAGIGNYRGQMSKTVLPEYLDKVNRSYDEDMANRKAQVDESRKLRDTGASNFLKYSNAPYEQRMLADKANLSEITTNRERFKEELLTPEEIKVLTDMGLPIPKDGQSLSEFAAKSPIYKMILDAKKKPKDGMTEYQRRTLGLRERELANKKQDIVRTPQADRAKIQDRNEAYLRATEAAKIAKNAYLGVGSTYIPDWARTQEGARAQSAILQMNNAYNKMISGGAITPQEAERLRKAMPNMSDPPENFDVKMQQYLQELKLVNENHMNMLEGEGYNTQPYNEMMGRNESQVQQKPSSGRRVIPDSEPL